MSSKTTTLMSVVRVLFTSSKTILLYNMNGHKVRVGDIVYVDGKMKDQPGRVIEIMSCKRNRNMIAGCIKKKAKNAILKTRLHKWCGWCRDWCRPLLQTVSLIVIICVLALVDTSGILTNVMTKANIELSEIDVTTRVIISWGEIAIEFFVFSFIFWFFRKTNRECCLNQGNSYHDQPYTAYWFCRHILGYRSCNLVRVPIPMQFMLVLKDAFPNFLYSEGIVEAPDDEIVKVMQKNADSCSKTVNIVLADTYGISENQLPLTVLKHHTIWIDRSSSDHSRHSSTALIKTAINTIHGLPASIRNVNIFATTNAHNTYSIAKQAFATGTRDHVRSIRVFQQDSVGNRIFPSDWFQIKL